MCCLIRFPLFHTAALKLSANSGCLSALGVCLILLAGAAPRAYASEIGATRTAQGSSRLKAVIEVRTSPAVYVPGPAFSVRVSSLKSVTPRVPELIQHAVEQTLVKNDPRLKVAPAPDTLIICTVTDLGVLPGLENRTRSEYRKIGETTVTDPATGMSRTEDQFGFVDVPYRALVFEGRLSVTCEVKDVATGIVLYSDRFDAVYTDARDAGFGWSSPSVDDLNTIYLRLADNAAGLILAMLSPRIYSSIAVLPSGRLKEVSKLLEASLWNDALVLLTSLPLFKDPKDEAYRLYSMGVAHEALAYKTQNPAETSGNWRKL